MAVHEIDVDNNIWGKSVPVLKGKTTRKKPIPVSGDLLHVPEELFMLHKYIYLMVDLFFVNSNPFLSLPQQEDTIYRCQPSYQHKSGYHIQGLQRDIQLLHEAWVPRHNYICIWIILPLQAII